VCASRLGGLPLVVQELGSKLSKPSAAAAADSGGGGVTPAAAAAGAGGVSGLAERRRLFRRVYALLETSPPLLAGVMLWSLAPRSYPDYDGYTIYDERRRASAGGGAGCEECADAAGATDAALLALVRGCGERCGCGGKAAERV